MELRQYKKEDIEGKRVLLRADLDVGVNEAGEVSEFDDLRLRRAAPTVKQLLDYGAAAVIILGHRGRPAGQFDANFSLQPVQKRLSNLLVQEIKLIADIKQPAAVRDKLVMLENTRFWPGEKTGVADFARALAAWGDVYVNDAFSNSHRSDASMLALPKILPAFAGPGLINEIKELTRFITGTPRPYAAVLGGAKIETKLPLLKQLLRKADAILVGGALANTILAGRGINVGKSLVEQDYFAEAQKLTDPKIILPLDAVMADHSVRPINNIDSQGFIGDIGPATAALFKEKISAAKAILWNGPLGKFEEEPYQAGTAAVVAAITESAAATVTGGGDTLDVLTRLNAVDKFGFVSVGGGAMLTFLAGEPMPALEVLSS